MAMASSPSTTLVSDEKPPLGFKQGLKEDARAPYGRPKALVRLFLFVTYFLTSCFVIVATQLIGAPLYFYNREWYYAWMARTKQHFGIVITSVTEWWSPTVIRVTGDRSVRHQLKRTEDGRLVCDFPERMILIANHQIYSDWLYLWWIAYTARMHGFIHIILKESLKYIPVIGQGMMFYGFIFLARNWAKDKPRFVHRLSKLAKMGSDSPMWLMIFPEGTNLSDNGRANSTKYAKKIGIEDYRHVLLPRTTGLQFCLEHLHSSVEWMYDCTVAYEGIPRGEYGQDIFTLYSMFFQGQPPKSVNMHWRRFKVADIPFQDPAAFELWLRERWQEKDDMMEFYLVNGYFPEDDGEDEPHGKHVNGNAESTLTKRIGGRTHTMSTIGGASKDGTWNGAIETEVKLNNITEPAQVFSTVLTFGLVVNVLVKLYYNLASAV